MRALPQRERAPLNKAWALMAQTWDMSPQLAGRLWTALRLSQSPESRTICYHLEGMTAPDRQRHSFQKIQHIAWSVCSPVNLIEAFEQCYEANLLDRVEASRAQDIVLQHVAADGRWKEQLLVEQHQKGA